MRNRVTECLSAVISSPRSASSPTSASKRRPAWECVSSLPSGVCGNSHRFAQRPDVGRCTRSTSRPRRTTSADFLDVVGGGLLDAQRDLFLEIGAACLAMACERASGAVRMAERAYQGPQFHQGLVELADVLSRKQHGSHVPQHASRLPLLGSSRTPRRRHRTRTLLASRMGSRRSNACDSTALTV